MKPRDFQFNRFHVDLSAGTFRAETRSCEDMEDVLGGIARGFKVLAGVKATEPYAPDAVLLMNTGILTGTPYMTGLRTFFQGYSPLKRGKNGNAAPMWSAGSGKLGSKLRWLGVDEALFTGRCDRPTVVRIHRPEGADTAQLEFLDGSDLVGKRVHDKIMALQKRFPDGHFAVIGPAGEAYEDCRFAAIALSTVNELKSEQPKARFCGRGGFGGVMGSKNLLAIVVDGGDSTQRPTSEVKAINQEISKGKGSMRYRDAKRGGLGGTWSIYEILGPIANMPENNFNPTGDESISKPLYREVVEKGPYVVKDENCFMCAIRCHKNVYDETNEGKPGVFRAKLDYEPLNLLSSNIGIFDIDPVLDLVALTDDLGMDSISLGGVLAFAMEYNRRHPEAPILDGLSFGNAEKARAAVLDVGEGRCRQLGQGVMRLSEEVGEDEYAMHSKGVEYPAYLPHTNPGYPFALAGGHMSMRTYLLIVFEKETGMDYWVEAITERGPMAMRDDMIGICKFARSTETTVVDAIRSLTDLEITEQDLFDAVRRTYLRGYQMERRQGFTVDDYVLPAICHEKHPHIQAPYFNTPEFFTELRDKVIARFDAMLAAESGL